MNRKLVAILIAGASLAPLAASADTAAPATPAAPASPHTFTANVGVVTDYLFRGISQTHANPAIQGGFDYSHASGVYLGIWGSSISWVSDTVGGSYPTEIDVYGGYKGSFAGDWGYDLGLITYNYPGNGRVAGSISPNTTEVYGALSYKWLSVKYSHVTSSHFVGWTTTAIPPGDTRGTGYLEANANYDLGSGWGISGHVGHQKVKGNSPASYSDWKVGVTKDMGFGVIGLAYSDTNTKGTCTTTGGTNAYCWTTDAFTNPTNFKDVSRGTAILSFSKSF
jgi:uncharacterized protein (TIGR02001 family)